MTGREPPGLGKRIVARLLDGLIVGIPVGILVALAGIMPTSFLGGLLVDAAHFGYFVWLEGTRGQTVGKKVLGMRVVRPDGRTADMESAVRRNWWLLLGIFGLIGSVVELAVVLGIMVTIASDTRGQGFHDRMADAIVVDVD